MAGPGEVDLSFLTREHAIKVPTRHSVEKCSLAVGEKIGHENVVSASRMNNAVVLFLKSEDMAYELIVDGIVVDDEFISVLPLSSPARKVILSNVPPFIPDEVLAESLTRYGKLVSQIRKMTIATTSPLLKHVVSFRRSVYMALKEPEIDLTLNVKVAGFNYAIFVTSKSMKCFGCGQMGHLLRTCPDKNKTNQSADSGVKAPASDSETNVNPPQAPQAPQITNVEAELGDDVQNPPQPAETEGATTTADHGSSQNAQSVDVSQDIIIEPENAQSTADTQHTQSSVDARPDLSSEHPTDNMNDEGNKMETEGPFKKPSKRRRSSPMVANKVAKTAECTGTDESDTLEDESDYSSDCSITYSVPRSGYPKQAYTVEDVKTFLQKTKHKHKVRIDMFFPDVEQFIEKTKLYQKQGLFEEREWWRLSKFLTKLNADV